MVAFYLGQAGSLLQIKTPANLDPPQVRKGGTHDLLAGGSVRDTIGYRRKFTVGWEYATTDELSVLELLYQIAGPLVFVDPSRRNLLEANQSSGTATLKTTDGFVATTGTLTSDATANPAIAAARSLKWNNSGALGSTGNGPFTGTSTSTANLTDDVPVVAGLPYSFSVTAQRSAANAISVGARIAWYDTTGALISGTTGTGVALASGSWSVVKLENQTAPAGAAFAKVAVHNTATTSGATAVFMAGWQLEQATAASAWVLGTGVPKVTFDDLVPSLQMAWDAVNTRWHATGILIEV